MLNSIKLNSDSDKCKGGESIENSISFEEPFCLIMPPHLIPKFFIGFESPKDAWAKQA